MRFSRSESVAQRRKDQKLRNKFKGKKKHKRLDAICEKAYNRSHSEVQRVESSQVNNGGNDFELRRSNRARRAPVLLDSSPMPPKKRQKVDRSVASSVEKVKREDRVQRETLCSSLRDLDGENGGWGSRLRSRGRSRGSSRRGRGESSQKGKRKLFDDNDGFGDDMKPQSYDKKEDLVGEKSTVVKSKRPGRIKASNVLANENQAVDSGGGMKDGKEKNRHEVLEVMNEVDGLQLEIKLECRSETAVEDCHVASKLVEREETLAEREEMLAEREEMLAEREETAVQRDSELKECHDNGNVETRQEHVGMEKIACDLSYGLRNVAEVDCTISEQAKDDGHPARPLEDENMEKSKGKYIASAVADSKPRIKLGRRCGLCGGGTDGKPPKILVLEGAGSDNEAYSGSSSSEEPNYDIWDGFGDQSGWLGRLLGPINDRFGIAGIWVHQHCAVWSPEVYFAGLGCLKNVRAALYRGRALKCSRCSRPGATIGCRVDRCPKTYHLPCARAKGCIFDHRKFLIACTDHRHLFQPHGIQNAERLKKMKARKLKLELRKMVNDACRKDIETEEKWLENCGEDEEFLKRESKRLHRDLWRIAPTYIGGANFESERQFQGWESVAGLQDVIRCMKEVVILPLLYPEFFNNIGLTPPRGVLLHGYPGTGKTLVVRALVGSCARGDRRIAYFARKGADCLGKYVGDAERQLRLLFQVAEKSQPSIIFFDEIDGLAPCRTKQQDQTHNSVVSTLLALMDGLKSRGSVIVIGATNRPDSVDPALRRPGRFDREIYFPLPSVKDREAILSLHTQKWPKPITGSLLKGVAKRTVGFAGADLQALCTQAAISALRRSFPLQEVLSAAETRASDRKCPAIPTFAVEERDWLQALSCAPPPCSRRESGIALHDVVSSHLKIHLVPCLLNPLTRLLVCLCMDERVWLPLQLSKASKLVKNVIISALDSRRAKSDNWWLHIDGLLQEVDVTNEIVNNLLLSNVLIGESNLCGSIEMQENTNEGSHFIPSESQYIGSRPGLLQNMSSSLSSKSGFQVLICGNPRSGQKHLASCLVHCFVGSIDIWKVDLASISYEGHGDMVHGLTRILMRCASPNLCMLYMPTIDLWAVETYDEASEVDCEASSMEPLSSEKISCDGHCEGDMGHGLCPGADVEAVPSHAAVKKASYLWTSFIEQLESIRVNTSLIILATSELPFSLLPNRIRQFFGNEFFGNELLDCSLSSPLDHKVPCFSVQLDGKFDHQKVINSFAAKLSNDLAEQFVRSLHGQNHIHEKPFEEKAYDTVEGDVGGVSCSKSCHVSQSSPVGITNKALKGRSNLHLAISTFGYQILCYPHFAELCWVTSKLKEGPCANAGGPWKGWPFNSCIVRPVNSTDKVAGASGSSNTRCKESGLVGGLVAVGLSAYRGEYTSLREVCSEVRKVLETLVGRIDDKIQAGKDRTQFIRILSQVAYLEDMVISWAHALQSLEVDANICAGLDGNRLRNDQIAEGDVYGPDTLNVNLHGPEVFEKGPQEVDARDAGNSDPTDGNNGCPDPVNEVAVTVEGPFDKVVLDDSCSLKHTPNEANSDSDDGEAAGDHAKSEHIASVKIANGFRESSSNFQADGPVGSGYKHITRLSSSAEVGNQPNDPSSTDNNILSKDTNQNSGGSDPDVNYSSNPSSLTGDSTALCFYQCCSECFVNLHNLILRITNIEWGFKGSDSTLEDVHDFVASISANLHLSLSKLSQDKNSRKIWEEGGEDRKYCPCLRFKGMDEPECKDSEKLLMMECGCHETNKNTASKENSSWISQGLDCRFVFKDGVLANLDAGSDVSYHCKFEKLCLCFLIEWLVMRKESFD